MLSEDILRRALHAAGLEAPVAFQDDMPSTNRTAMELAEAGSPAWTVVAANHQTEGRGRLGRSWISEPGSSVLFSVLLRPRLDPDGSTIVALGAGAAAAEACSGASKVDVACKWPNDLLVGEAKVGGILCESAVASGQLRHIVVGVGINLTPPSDVEGAGGLGDVDVEDLLGRFLARFRELIDAGPGPVLAAYRPRCATLGRAVRVHLASGRLVEGIAEDLDGRGALIVRGDEGAVIVGFGEVVHLRP